MREFKVGNCFKRGEMYMRAVVPVFDDRGIHGLIGRSLNPKCQICGYHHYTKRNCPNNDVERSWGVKWKVQKGFRKENYLYNLSRAQHYIEQSRSIILVESPGNVWRCWENGIRNVVAIFGVSLTDNQQALLEKLFLKWVYICLDNDLAGRNGEEKIASQLSRLFLVKRPKIKYGQFNDFGEMDDDYFKKEVLKELI